ncbi:MAG: hypothetical protein RLZZ367_2514 [Bacteroidota bacterium]|jgi:hypothetical protein
MKKSFLKYLNKETDGTTLHIFRIFFGLILALQLYDFYFLTVDFSKVPFRITYDFFHFIKPVCGLVAKIVYIVFCSAAVLAALGVLFRLSMLIATIGVAYSFLIDQTIYNNHYYLFILVGIVLVFTGAGKGLTIFKPRTVARIPMRNIWVMRFLVCLVYFYGGINKINYDWLVYAEPVYTWLPEMLGKWVLNLSTSQYKALAFFIAYSGMLLDLLAGIFLLFENRLKHLLLPVLFLFHCMNGIFFNIGYFPYFSLTALLLFLPPQQVTGFLTRFFTLAYKPTTQHNVAGNTALTILVTIQLLLPLRHLLIPGNYLWTERAILFSWTMKLRDKEPIINITYRVAGTKQYHEVPVHQFTTERQLRHLGYRPTDLVQFAHFVEDTFKRKLQVNDIEVYAEIFTCLNHYRPFQLLVNPYIDLTTIDIKNKPSLVNYDWIVPLGEDNFNLIPPAELIDNRKQSLPAK